MPLADEERREVDKACLGLLDHKDLKADVLGRWFKVNHYGRAVPLDQPSQDPHAVVPLTSALRKAGWEMGEIMWDIRGYRVTLERTEGAEVRSDWHAAMEEALAVAAARAVEKDEEE